MQKSSAQLKGIVKTHPHIIEGLASHKHKGGKIAPGFTPAPWLDMTYQGGRTIADLSFRSFYLGGLNWADADVHHIDSALSGAMADPYLNNVLLQYYPGRKSITSRFLGSEKLAGTVAKTYTRDSVNPTLKQLLNAGKLNDIDFDNTVICLFLPPGIVLDTRAKGGVGKMKGDDDDRDSSLHGLGGYHGSAHVGNKRIYFAAGVYSEVSNGKANGIPFWPDPWKNIVATFYHELNEARTNPDVEEFNRTHKSNTIAWYADADGAGEIGDIPMNEAGDQLGLVMVEVKLANGNVAPIQLMWSNKVHGPQGPFS
jgi:hypothetical protein